MTRKAASHTGRLSPAEAAAYWVVRSDRELGVREEAEFARWLADPVNAAAFDKARDAMRVFDPFADTDPQLQTMRRAARSFASPRRQFWLIAASLVAIGLIVPLSLASHGGWFPLHRPASVAPAPPTIASTAYTTRIGERRTVRLQDGSDVILNTGSEIAVNYTPGRRLVRLVRGQALFDVAHNANRPFSVDALGRRTTAVGTLFDVRVDAGRMSVVLARGKVLIESANDAKSQPAVRGDGGVYLEPGQEFIAEPGKAPRIRHVDVERELRWRDGFVEFEDVSLAAAVAEINRYSAQPIRLSPDGVGDLRVSGVFRTGDPRLFADAVSRLLPVRVEQAGPAEIKLSRAEAPKG